ncbi:MAG TPA: 4Fe-4S dicluster domain-containing protein [Syntrophorhabdaceae bacterium]|nr:4Fe-4S dicluster domain-containing protein [Syntrophorhabdaceae bacterium]HQK45490.1 4Fe-4S dicluster domain-containing protein [Syntrophorhabdaceae bacterium]HRR71266.1 4Fe-4S dicluster domain-containing protein [Syntrophorhabdaceae bacterium]
MLSDKGTKVKEQMITVKIDDERCKGCSLCVEFCPKGSLSISDRLNMKGYFVVSFSHEKGCTGCATCALVCPDVAIEVFKN